MHGILHSITVYQCIYKSISRKEKRQRALFPIALFHNLIFIYTRNQCKSSFFQVNLSGGVDEADSEDFSFESFSLPVHSAGSVYLYDSDLGSALNHTRSSFIVSVRRVSRWEQKPSKTLPSACSSFSQGTKMAVIVPAQRL